MRDLTNEDSNTSYMYALIMLLEKIEFADTLEKAKKIANHRHQLALRHGIKIEEDEHRWAMAAEAAERKVKRIFEKKIKEKGKGNNEL